MAPWPGAADRYVQRDVQDPLKLVRESVEGQVPYKRPVGHVLHQLVGGRCAAMGYTGAKTIGEFDERARFVRTSAASLRESHIHDVTVTRESLNCPIR